MTNRLLHEGMSFHREHEVVGHADGDRFGQDYFVVKEGVYPSQAADIEIHVNSAIVVEHKIPDSICALYRILVVVECLEEPHVVVFNKLPRGLVGPQHVFAAEQQSALHPFRAPGDSLVGHEIFAALRDDAPSLWQNLRLPGLVYYARNFLVVGGGMRGIMLSFN